MQAYSNPKRESDPYSLPDVEVFHASNLDIFDSGFVGRCDYCNEKDIPLADGYGSDQPLCLKCAKNLYGSGWFWRTCLPGCMPDSDPFGPFATKEEALADAQDGCDEFEDEEQ
jgi:hypothetical protein